MIQRDDKGNSTPLISIITIVKDAATLIEHTIKNVINQSYNSYEYIVIDGASSDGTVNSIKLYDKSITSWISESDQGISDAFNKGIQQARGKWILFINAGDSFASSNVLSLCAPILLESNGFDIVHGCANYVDKNGNVLHRVGRALDKRRFQWSLSIPHQAIFHSACYFKEFGVFDTSFKVTMDYELLTRKKNLQARFISQTICNMLAGGISQSNYRKLLSEAARVREKNIAPRTIWSNSVYAWKLLKISVILQLRKILGEKFI